MPNLSTDKIHVWRSAVNPETVAFIRTLENDEYESNSQWLTADEARAVRDTLTEILGDSLGGYRNATPLGQEPAPEPEPIFALDRAGLDALGTVPVTYVWASGRDGFAAGADQWRGAGYAYRVADPAALGPWHPAPEPDHGSRVFVLASDYIAGCGINDGTNPEASILNSYEADGEIWHGVLGLDPADFHPVPEPRFSVGARVRITGSGTLGAAYPRPIRHDFPIGEAGTVFAVTGHLASYGFVYDVVGADGDLGNRQFVNAEHLEPAPRFSIGDRVRILVDPSEFSHHIAVGSVAVINYIEATPEVPGGFTYWAHGDCADGFGLISQLYYAEHLEPAPRTLRPGDRVILAAPLTDAPAVGDQVVVIDGGGSRTTPHYPVGHVGTVTNVWPPAYNPGDRIVEVSGLDSGIFTRRLGRVLS